MCVSLSTKSPSFQMLSFWVWTYSSDRTAGKPEVVPVDFSAVLPPELSTAPSPKLAVLEAELPISQSFETPIIRKLLEQPSQCASLKPNLLRIGEFVASRRNPSLRRSGEPSTSDPEACLDAAQNNPYG